MASQELINIIIKAQDEASATAKKVDDSIKKIGDNSRRLSNIPGIDGLKNKLSSVATTIDGKFGGALTKARNKFTTFKNSITTAASNIKGKFGGAIDGVRAKLSSLTNGLKKTESSFGFLRGAASMAAGMIGYDLFNSIMETTRASLNARSSMQSFAKRLNMSSEEVKNFQKSLDEMQSSYKKIDMDVVGQQATDMAYRLGLPKESLSELTETTAIFTDAMQRNGRSAEDSMLAMSDAMDGQFVRLKEIGIGQDDLMKNGWSGDINDKTGLLQAMNKALKDQHYDDLAKSVDTLDDAWQVLSITMGNLLEKVLVPLTPVIVGIVDGLTGFFDLIMNNPLAQIITLIAGASIGFGLLAGAISVAMAAEGGLMALMPGFVASLYSAASGFMAISVAGAPLWAIVAVVAAVALAVYELGIAFGWWKDVGSMLEAISAGATRLWNAFINHPDVQAAIEVISNALSVLWGYIQQAGQAILDFFGIATGGEFDIVRALIDGIGSAWNNLKGFMLPVIATVQTVITAFNAFRTGQMDLPSFIWTILSSVAQMHSQIFTMIINLVVKFGSQLLSRGISAARGFVNGIVNRIRALPGRVYSLLLNVVGRIRSAIQSWISAGVEKVNSLISQITSPFSGVAGKITSGLSGVANAILSPFKTAWSYVEPYINKIKEGIDSISSLGGLFAGGEYAGGEEIVTTGGQTIEIKEDLNVTLDLANVPSHMSESSLIEALSSREVLSALVSNRTFQSLDTAEKQKLLLKQNRSRGV